MLSKLFACAIPPIRRPATVITWLRLCSIAGWSGALFCLRLQREHFSWHDVSLNQIYSLILYNMYMCNIKLFMHIKILFLFFTDCLDANYVLFDKVTHYF